MSRLSTPSQPNIKYKYWDQISLLSYKFRLKYNIKLLIKPWFIPNQWILQHGDAMQYHLTAKYSINPITHLVFLCFDIYSFFSYMWQCDEEIWPPCTGPDTCASSLKYHTTDKNEYPHSDKYWSPDNVLSLKYRVSSREAINNIYSFSDLAWSTFNVKDGLRKLRIL